MGNNMVFNKRFPYSFFVSGFLVSCRNRHELGNLGGRGGDSFTDDL